MKITLIINTVKDKLLWFLDSFFWIINVKRKEINLNKPPLTIGVTTFMNRFHSCLIPLINKLTKLFPETEIIIVANGHILKEEQIEYLKKISKYCLSLNNIKLIKHKTPIGLSKIWNQIVKISSNENILILNDDVDIKANFDKQIFDILNNANKLTLLNNSWSHFIINKELHKENGPFDEALLEIGGEDDDYTARMALNNILINGVSLNSIKGKLKEKQKKLTINSYGKDMNNQASGYSNFNTNYLQSKWIFSDQYFSGATKVPDINGQPARSFKYCKLKIQKKIND